MKYKALRLISDIFLILAIQAGIGGFIGGGLLSITRAKSFEMVGGQYEVISGDLMVGQGIALAIGGLVAAAGLLAFIKLFRLFINIETNTRLPFEYLDQQLDAPAPRHVAPLLDEPLTKSNPLLPKHSAE